MPKLEPSRATNLHKALSAECSTAASIDESTLCLSDIQAEFASRRRKTQTKINNLPCGEVVSGIVLPANFRL